MAEAEATELKRLQFDAASLKGKQNAVELNKKVKVSLRVFAFCYDSLNTQATGLARGIGNIRTE
jgi:hypothetical protein